MVFAVVVVISTVIIGLALGIVIKEKYVFNVERTVLGYIIDVMWVFFSILAVIVFALSDKESNKKLLNRISFCKFVVFNTPLVISISIILLAKLRKKAVRLRNTNMIDASQCVRETERDVQNAYQFCHTQC